MACTICFMPGSIWKWVLFNAFVVAMLALDLGVVHRRKHEIRFKEALAWSAVWIGLALAFGAGVARWDGREKGLALTVDCNARFHREAAADRTSSQRCSGQGSSSNQWQGCAAPFARAPGIRCRRRGIL